MSTDLTISKVLVYCECHQGWWFTQSQWERTLTQTTSATVPGQLVALRGLEWSHTQVGHIEGLQQRYPS